MGTSNPTKSSEVGDFWRHRVDADGYLEVFRPRGADVFTATAVQFEHRRTTFGFGTFGEAARAARQMHVAICADNNIVVF